MKINSSIIFESSNFLIKLIIIISILLLLRGHNSPGGGFIGGLTFICAYILMKINIHETYLIEKVIVRKSILMFGVLLLIFSVIYPITDNQVPMAGVWYSFPLDHIVLKIGTPLIFDIGVYIVISMGLSFIVDYLEESWF